MLDINLDSLEAQPCPRREIEKYYIYFLLYNDEVVYVGKTVSVANRVLAHTSDKLFDSYKYFELDTLDHKEVLKIERYHINKYKPVFNDSLTSTYKDKNIFYDRNSNRTFYKDIVYNMPPYTYKKKVNYDVDQTTKVVYNGEDLYHFDIDRVSYLYKNKNQLKKDTKEYKEALKSIEKYLPKKEIITNKEPIYLFIKGKYKGHSYSKILNEDRSYINWMIQNVPNYTTTMIKLQENKEFIIPRQKYLDKFVI